MYLADQIPVNVINRRADPSANLMFAGPTAVDFSMLSASSLVLRSEAQQLAAWRAADLASHYREIRRRDFR